MFGEVIMTRCARSTQRTRRTQSKTFWVFTFVSFVSFVLIVGVSAADVWDSVEHAYADSNGVKIHYATMGKGPVVVMIHGFPDFWYTWRAQMAGLADSYQMVAIGPRGHNRNDK